MDSYGAMKSVIFKRIGVGGLDICEVELEHEETEWRIIRGQDERRWEWASDPFAMMPLSA